MKSIAREDETQKSSAKAEESVTIIELARRAKKASRVLARLSHEQRVVALHSMAEKIEQAAEQIIRANKIDLDLLEKENVPDAYVLKKRLGLDANKLKEICLSIREVAKMPDPIGQKLMSRELDEGLVLTKVACPIGLVAIIFESRPDALPQIISLCLKSGNAAVLKGGTEANRTNGAIFECIVAALKENEIATETFALTHKREDVELLLGAKGVVDLIIPRGSNALVSYIMKNTQIPVLGHAAGICHVYVDLDADLQKAHRICVDAKTTYPAACNAAETILVHESVAAKFIPQLLEELAAKNVEMRCDEKTKQLLAPARAASSQLSQLIKDATADDFGTEFSNLTIAIKVVNDIEDAVDHINTYSSNHTDAIITENDATAEKFFEQVDSAGVYQNASTRFADGFRYGFGAEVGISNGKLHPRGPVGLDGLTTYKYRLKGDGHVVADYSGHGARPFTHRDLD